MLCFLDLTLCLSFHLSLHTVGRVDKEGICFESAESSVHHRVPASVLFRNQKSIHLGRNYMRLLSDRTAQDCPIEMALWL